MSSYVVVDTNVVVAYIDKRDKWSPRASALYASFQTHDVQVLYLDCVINEAITAMGRRAEEQKRGHQFRQLFDALTRQTPKSVITWVSQETEHLYDEIVALVRQTDGTLNFHDALIALFCRDSNLSLIVSFDQDFDQINWLTRIDTPSALQQALGSE